MKLHGYLLSALLVVITSNVNASSYFVSSSSGLDTNPGTSPAAPFKTLQKAADSTHPGDTVYAMEGIYMEPYNADVVMIHVSGTKSAPITFTNYKGQNAKIVLNENNWRGINVAAGTQYIVINGFEISGINQSLTWSGANGARLSGLAIAKYNGTGVCCNGTFDDNTKEGGIGSLQSDYLTIRNNVIWNCAWYSSYNGSGISTCENANTDNNSAGYRIVITGNKVYNCAAYIGSMQIPWRLTDGNGIIIDDADCTGTSKIAFTGRTLVADNLVYDCGGRGVNVGSSNNVDVINNTLYHNANSYSQADVHIDVGGLGTSNYAADKYFSDGTVESPWTGDVDTSQLSGASPAPADVYRSGRRGTSSGGFTYTIPAKRLCSYLIVLHFSEDRWDASDKRQFNVSINGNPWLTNFDIFGTAGAMHRAVAEQCFDTSDPDGKIVISFTPGKYDVPKVDGIEVLPDNFSPVGEIAFDSTITPVGTYHCCNNIIWPNQGAPAIAQWNVKASQIDVDSNLYYDGSGSHPATPFDDKEALWTDPLFVSPGTTGDANFHLRNTSPAIKAGNKSYFVLPIDLDGKPRHDGAAVDIGAYQH
jgi:hypothetical protein